MKKIKMIVIALLALSLVCFVMLRFQSIDEDFNVMREQRSNNLTKHLMKINQEDLSNFNIIGEYNNFESYEKNHIFMKISIKDVNYYLKTKYENIEQESVLLEHKENKRVFCIMNKTVMKKCFFGQTNKPKTL